MQATGWLLVFASFLAGVTAVAVGTYAWRNREEPGATAFAVLMGGVAVWSLSYALALTVFDPELRRLMEVPLEVGKAMIAPAWLLFAFGYTGRGEYVTRKVIVALSVLPAVTLVLVATNPIHGLMWTDYRIVPTFGAATVVWDPGVWHYVHAAYGWAVIGTGMVFMLEPVLAYGALYRDQGVALILGAAVGFIAHVKATFFLPPARALDLTPIALAATGLFFGFALFRFELQGRLPATQVLGRRAAIEDVGVGVVVVSGGGRVVEFNEAARSVFAGAPDVDEPLEAVVPNVDLSVSGPQRVERNDADGYRAYEATVSAVTDHHDRTVGYTVTFTDVTEREVRRQRLEVLNRVLRHNLRNDMTVVVGNADLLAERVAEEHRRLADAVARRGRALQRLGEKARDVERLLAGEEPPRELSVPAVCRAVLADLREAFPAADSVAVTVDGEKASGGDAADATDAADSATSGSADASADGVEALAATGHDDGLADGPLCVRVRESVLRAVVSNLLENALEHGSEPVTLRVGADADGGVEIVIADAGPGIPDHELATLERGEETALDHGSGLGLWVVRWGTRLLGASLSFEDREPSGTVATVRLPPTARADSAEGTPEHADADDGPEGGAGSGVEPADADAELDVEVDAGGASADDD